MLGNHPIQNSEVYVCRPSPGNSVPPPSPPSPLTPAAANPGDPIEEFCLEGDSASELSISERRPSNARRRLSGAFHVLNTEASALASLANLYKVDDIARGGFDAAIDAITRHPDGPGKLVMIGIGKSGHIAKKLVATFCSLGLHAAFLHPTEAVHGDLGMIGRHDTVFFITFSGRTPELLALLPHIDSALPAVVLTSHRHPGDCEIVRRRPGTILLPAPVVESETVSFGVSAPTTSTTVALALGDALALVAADELHLNAQHRYDNQRGSLSTQPRRTVASVFAKNHPGGAIGAAFHHSSGSRGASNKTPPRATLRDLAVPLQKIPLCDNEVVSGLEILRTGYRSQSGLVRIGNDHLSSVGLASTLSNDQLTNLLATEIDGLVEQKSACIVLPADMDLEKTEMLLSNSSSQPLSSSQSSKVKGKHTIILVADSGGNGDIILGATDGSRVFK